VANSRTPAELKNCKLENPFLIFGPLAQYLGSDKRWVLSMGGDLAPSLGGRKQNFADRLGAEFGRMETKFRGSNFKMQSF